MNGTDILADTNAIIYFVNGNDVSRTHSLSILCAPSEV